MPAHDHLRTAGLCYVSAVSSSSTQPNRCGKLTAESELGVGLAHEFADFGVPNRFRCPIRAGLEVGGLNVEGSGLDLQEADFNEDIGHPFFD